jgi:AcrR family transcriptional regulator
MGTGQAASMGLRERKKRATRQALSWAVVRLAVERGLERVRVEDIAAAAGVSPRTFNNYFSSKEEALVAIPADRAASAATALRARPAGEPLWEAVIRAVTEQFDVGEPDRAWVARAHLMTNTPALQGEYLKSRAAIAHALAEAIAERTGTDAERDLYPRLVAAAVVSAEQLAIEHWLRFDTQASLLSMVRHALEQLAAGLPPPAGTGKGGPP